MSCYNFTYSSGTLYMDPRADISLGNRRAGGKIGASRQGCLNGKKEITCGGDSTTESFCCQQSYPK